MAGNEHVREFLTYYCALPKEPQYAVLLSGPWGSGKTWFIKNFIASHVPNPKRVLYLSLYGVQTFDDVESELFRLLHPVLGSKPVRFLHRLARGVIKTSINFDLDGDSKSDGSISAGVPSDRMLDGISLDADQILVLDDLERCSIPTADILGYVNQFVEHGGIKAILVANEAELHRQDNRNEILYARIKEKLIGRTFEVVPEVASALDSFASDLPTEKGQEIVRRSFSLISQVYECSKYKNLRLVRHALWDFDRLTRSLDQQVLRSDQLVADLLALFLTYSFEVHSGTIKANEIAKLRDSWSFFLKKNKDESDPDQMLEEVRSKYSGLNLYASLVPDAVWEAMFSTGSIPKDELNQSLLKSKYFQNENQPNWVKLWYGLNLSDNDFEAVLAQVQSEWDTHQYRKLGEVVHVTGLLIRFARNGIGKYSVEDTVRSARQYIEVLLESGDLPVDQVNSRPSPFERDAYAGLQFASLDDEEFQAFLQFIEDRRQAALHASFPAEAARLLSLIGTDTNLFYRRVIHNNDRDNIYYKTPILHLISPTEFVLRLLAAAPDDRRTVAYALKERYSVHQFNMELLPEIDWLREVAELLRSQVEARAGRVSSLALRSLLDPYIVGSIAQLEQAHSESKA